MKSILRLNGNSLTAALSRDNTGLFACGAKPHYPFVNV